LIVASATIVVVVDIGGAGALEAVARSVDRAC
jgi:hypothetical protein